MKNVQLLVKNFLPTSPPGGATYFGKFTVFGILLGPMQRSTKNFGLELIPGLRYTSPMKIFLVQRLELRQIGDYDYNYDRVPYFSTAFACSASDKKIIKNQICQVLLRNFS